jgi:multidrug resistance protein, MATE family
MKDARICHAPYSLATINASTPRATARSLCFSSLWPNCDAVAVAVASSKSLNVVELARTPVVAVLKLAAPTVLAMLLQSLVNDIDIYFFRKLPGAEGVNAQAALGPSLIMLWLFGGSISAISVGTQALTARRYAEARRVEQANQAAGNATRSDGSDEASEAKVAAAGAVLTNSLAFCLVSGVLMSVVAYFSMGFLLSKIVKVPAALDTAIAYSRWRVFGIVSMVTTIGVKSFLDGIGKTYVHLVACAIMNVFNVLFCYMFIFGAFGAPRLGAPGAGLGAFTATWIGLAIVLGFALREQRTYQFLRVANLSKQLLRDLLALSAPAALATVVMMGGFAVFNSFAGTLDARAGITGEAVNLAVTTDIIAVMKLIFTACLGFGTATATLVGQSMGAKRPDLATMFGWTSVRIGFVLFATVGLGVGVLFTEPLAHFLSDAPLVQAKLIAPLRIMGIVAPVISIALIVSEALFGAGATVFVAIAQLCLVFGALIPLGYVLSLVLNLGVTGMWLAAACYAVLAAIAMSIKFHRGDWKTRQI